MGSFEPHTSLPHKTASKRLVLSIMQAVASCCLGQIDPPPWVNLRHHFPVLGNGAWHVPGTESSALVTVPPCAGTEVDQDVGIAVRGVARRFAGSWRGFVDEVGGSICKTGKTPGGERDSCSRGRGTALFIERSHRVRATARGQWRSRVKIHAGRCGGPQKHRGEQARDVDLLPSR